MRTASGPIRCPRARFGRSAQAAKTRQPGCTGSRSTKVPAAGCGSSTNRHQLRSGRASGSRSRTSMRGRSELVGDRNPREHEFAVQLRSFDAAKSGDQSGCGGAGRLWPRRCCGRPLKGGLAIVGGITLGGSIEPVHNPIDLVELALEKGATAVLDAGVMPPRACRSFRRCRHQGAGFFYLDAADALRKAVHEG